MKKIWDVKIGNNWSSYTVEARDYIEAGKKALKLCEPCSREEKWVSRTECIRETDA